MTSPNSAEIFRRWLLAVAVFAVLIFFFSPCWGAFLLWARVPEMQMMLEVRRGASVLAQVDHLGGPIADPLHRAIQWRLLFPSLGRLLHLPPAILFGLADVGCVLVLGYLIALLRRQGLAWLQCGLAGIALGAASWFFTSTGWLGYWDSWIALALLLVAFADVRQWAWFACVWAPWIDERFVLAAPLALLCRSVLDAAGALPATARFRWRTDLAVPAVLLAAFVVVRLGVLGRYSSSEATISGYMGLRHYLDAPLSRIALGIWDGLRVGWFFAGAGFFLLWKHPASAPAASRAPELIRQGWLLAAAVVLVVGIGLATAQDYSRSMTMVLPASVLGVILLHRLDIGWLTRALWVGACAAVLLPAHHVMNDRVNPIFYLYHELAALHTPPRVAMPELYELRAIHEMERGDTASAQTDLTLAIKLAVNPASPARQRGLLAASQGRWPDALRDFSLAVDHDAQNPESWFMRAQANLALGQTAAARSDFDHALTLAPPGWAARPDVVRFLARLTRTS
ncbi:hypothetical protein K0B96_10795 [Horticoccus luteus]|uniref:Tetratricopeptide repeat protein n=1 Tax=Horticoccus luteus TaxID=2862869 RepID=A0A8F9TU38_9BACT|nr:hypothetical protein [Horticoccus luteus]QYM77808.1 hypothetical protein K0B96_10795 [Horticoccus luteus]